ncbi:MAG: bifunctional phosphoribosylaminoimidazolecarboxamide formyltransferase/IMP cyclohydrolase [Chloroflexi bacterium]|nr:bifunctional phosphoribosylaminoimidazolecarboxamide formyltransferase/IMP cyclohydrolase [Chloroflexota bacterium]
MPIALFSVSDKTGLVDGLARPLHELGWRILASGGTANVLREAGIPVKEVADYTGSPEILGGRVKTLHPGIHGGLLARNTPEDKADLKKIKAEMIDLIAVNLYPFQQTVARGDATLEAAVENIDIGGVTLLRAAAKNFARVTVLTTPDDYPKVVAELGSQGCTSLETRRALAWAAFKHTAQYDRAITDFLNGEVSLNLSLYPVHTLRYGENPHQSATLYGFRPDAGPLGGKVLQGKALSYNNILDLDAAWKTASSFDRPTVCIVKHLSPCGVASAETLAGAYPLALASDPASAFGGVIAVNRAFDGRVAKALGGLFVECIVAPGFTNEALAVLAKKQNLRLVAMPAADGAALHELRSVTGGVLRQSPDLGDPDGTELTVVTERHPTEEECTSLAFAWKACQHVKSNAIVFARGEATLGIGGGQPNRVDCVHIAARRAGEANVPGAVMASDAFFPFPDSVEAAAAYGIAAIIQPGGSVRDQESIEAANRHNIAMVFTGVRHFRH